MSKSSIELNTKKFYKFLELFSLRAEVENKELLLNFKGDAISGLAKAVNGVLAVRGKITGTFADFGEIGIDNLAIIKNFFKSSQSESISVKKVDNKLISENKKLKFSAILKNPKYIVNTVLEDTFQSFVESSKGNEFVLSSPEIKKLINYHSTLNSLELIIKGKDNLITFIFEETENTLEVDFDITEKVEEFEVKLSKFFIDVISILSEHDITFSITKEAKSVYLSVHNDEINFEYILAPLSK